MGRPLDEIADCVAQDYLSETRREIPDIDRCIVRNAILETLGCSKEPDFMRKVQEAPSTHARATRLLRKAAPALFGMVCMTWQQFQFEQSEA